MVIAAWVFGVLGVLGCFWGLGAWGAWTSGGNVNKCKIYIDYISEFGGTGVLNEKCSARGPRKMSEADAD